MRLLRWLFGPPADVPSLALDGLGKASWHGLMIGTGWVLRDVDVGMGLEQVLIEAVSPEEPVDATAVRWRLREALTSRDAIARHAVARYRASLGGAPVVRPDEFVLTAINLYLDGATMLEYHTDHDTYDWIARVGDGAVTWAGKS